MIMDSSCLAFLQLTDKERCFIWWKCLELRGLRAGTDFDILVSKSCFQRLQKQFPHACQTSKLGDVSLAFPDKKIEIFKDLPPFRWKEEIIIANAEYLNHQPSMALSDLIEFKQHLGRAKDLEDIKLLEQK